MNYLKRLFGKAGKNSQPAEPVFPGESFSILRLNFPDGWGLATFNNSYNGYPNKSFFPWHVTTEFEIVDKNDNGHPVDAEAEKLIMLEEQVTVFLKQYNVVHFIGRVTRNGSRDLLYYIDKPNFGQAEVNAFCDGVMKERGINFGMQKDPDWKAVSGFIK